MIGERGLGIRTDSNKQTWEEADFPVVCDRCIGAKAAIRMMKTSFDRTCRVCDRPFTVFRWRPSVRERFKKTEICQVCAKSKNVCEACINDIETGEPLYERDRHIDLDNKFETPKDIVNIDYWAQLQAIEVRKREEEKKKREEAKEED